MRGMIESIAAAADVKQPHDSAEVTGYRKRRDAGELVETLPAHQFPGRGDRHISTSCDQDGQTVAEEATDVLDERAYEEARQRGIYRSRTVGLLRRYMRYSIETGRLPSLVGREFFRSNVTQYQVTTFEDRVIFVHDIETCLGQLDGFSQQVLARIVLQEYGGEDAARLLGCTRMTVHRVLVEALDELSAILVGAGLLDALAPNPPKPCQGGKTGSFSVSDCEDGK